MSNGISSFEMLIRIKGAKFFASLLFIKELVFIKPVVSHHSQQGIFLRNGFFWLKMKQDPREIQ